MAQKKKADAGMLALFEHFKELHPNNQEVYVETLENAMRWKYHVDQREKEKQHPQLVLETSLEALQQSEMRRYEELSAMPSYMRERFLLLASLFPGRMVYAAGSRVSGGYVEEWSDDNVRELRRKLGKKDRRKSDYDIALDMQQGERVEELRAALPSWADLLPFGSADKIPIGMWDFSKLPEQEHENAITHFSNRQWGKLMDMHNKYSLSPNPQCCNSGPTQRYFRWAIEKGLIKSDTPLPPSKAKKGRKKNA